MPGTCPLSEWHKEGPWPHSQNKVSQQGGAGSGSPRSQGGPGPHLPAFKWLQIRLGGLESTQHLSRARAGGPDPSALDAPWVSIKARLAGAQPRLPHSSDSYRLGESAAPVSDLDSDSGSPNCVCACTHTHMHTHAHTCTPHTCTPVCTHAHLHICTPPDMHTPHMHTSTPPHMHTCVHTGTPAHAHRVHTHTHAYPHTCTPACTHEHPHMHMHELFREPGALAFADSSPWPWSRTRPQRASTGNPFLSRRSCLASHSTAKDPAQRQDAVCITFTPSSKGRVALLCHFTGQAPASVTAAQVEMCKEAPLVTA